MPTPEPHLLEAIHRRLLDRDPVAPADLAKVVLDPLVAHIRSRFPEVPDPTMIDNAVTDAVLNYAERPQQYDPSKRGLLGYLRMAAAGDLRNAMDAFRRRQQREQSLDVVELEPHRRKRLSMAMRLSPTLEDDVMSTIATQRLAAQVRKAAETPQDAQVLQLMIDGERRTELFAAALGLEGLSGDERRREVKRHKDRLKKRLQRLGVTSDE